ncbi:hypothetical protein THAOC_26985, partial [Thalassiosira oceanica]
MRENDKTTQDEGCPVPVGPDFESPHGTLHSATTEAEHSRQGSKIARNARASGGGDDRQ